MLVRSFVFPTDGKPGGMTNSFSFSYAAGGISERWGHYAPQLLIAGIAGFIVLGWRSATPTALSVFGSTALLVLVILTWLQMRQHERRLCEQCARSIPLNASEQAARYRRRFAVTHAGSDLRLVALYLAVLLGSTMLLSVPHGRWAWAAIQTSIIYLILACSTHSRLQPWCPWCSNGGGGSEVGDSTPDLPRGPGRQLV